MINTNRVAVARERKKKLQIPGQVTHGLNDGVKEKAGLMMAFLKTWEEENQYIWGKDVMCYILDS